MSQTDIRSKFGRKLDASKEEAFIVDESQVPFGYIQSYRAADVGNGWWIGEPSTSYGIDLFIGDPQFLGRGLGRRVAREYSDRLLARHEVEKVFVDPRIENTRAIKCFSAALFQSCGEIVTPDGKSLRMERLSSDIRS